MLNSSFYFAGQRLQLCLAKIEMLLHKIEAHKSALQGGGRASKKRSWVAG
jgi:hypothetical protein